MIRKEYHFYGRVQGVGFRFWASMVAERVHVTGWIKNEFDGSVTAQVQGTREQHELFLKQLEEHRYLRITKMEEKIMEINPKERRFSTAY